MRAPGGSSYVTHGLRGVFSRRELRANNASLGATRLRLRCSVMPMYGPVGGFQSADLCIGNYFPIRQANRHRQDEQGEAERGGVGRGVKGEGGTDLDRFLVGGP